MALGPYLLDSQRRSLTRGGEPVGLSQYEYELLHLLVRRQNLVVSKDVLIRAGWHDVMGLGPPLFLGIQGYRLFQRNPAG